MVTFSQSVFIVRMCGRVCAGLWAVEHMGPGGGMASQPASASLSLAHAYVGRGSPM